MVRRSGRDPLAVPREIVRFQRRLAARSLRAWSNTVGSVFGLPAASVPVLSWLQQRLDPHEVDEQHAFLTAEWIAAARAVRAEYAGRASIKPPVVRVNLVVTDVPFGDDRIEAHADTSSGDLQIELGHVADVDATVTAPYDVTKALLVDGDAAAALQAFTSGRVKVEGDVAKLLSLQTAQVDPLAIEETARIRAMTI